MLLLALAPAAQADDKGDCGTIVLPTGAGQAGSGDLTSFSPIYADSAYNQGASWLLYPDLLWINRFSQIDWSRSLATAVTTSADNTTFTVTMRPWVWSDGVPVTASDSAYFFELAKKLGPTWPGYGGGGLPDIVKSFTVLSPSQFQVVTKHPVNPKWFIYNAIAGLIPLPEHVWRKYSLDQQFQLQSTPSFYDVVDGPLKLKSIVIGQDAVFVPNPAWPGPKMHFSRLVFRFLQGDGASVQGVESGETDEGQLPTTLFSSVKNVPGVHVEVLEQGLTENVLNLNFKNPDMAPFKDVRVRQAAEDAIDQEAIEQGLEHGDGDVAYGPVPHSMTAFLSPAMRKGIYPVGYDLANARALLAQAGYTPGADGIMQKDGRRLSFTELEETGTQAALENIEIVQADLLRAGIEMKIHEMEFNQILTLMSSSPNDWDASSDGTGIGYYPSGEGSFQTGAFQNMSAYSDPKMDRLINDNINEPGDDNLFAYETYVSEQQPVIFLPRSRPVVLVSNRLHGIADFINPIGMYAPDKLYCSGEGPKH